MLVFISNILLISLLVIATVTDFRSRRIPNWLTLAGFFLGLLLSVLSAGIPGVFSSIAGAVVGIVIFIPVYALGKMGAGDVKLLAMVGAFLGPVNVLWAALFSLMAGGLLAVGWMIYKAGPRALFYRVMGSVAMARVPGQSVNPNNDYSPLKAKMPFAAAIGAGAIATWFVEL